MADNTLLNVGVGGDTLRTEDRTTYKTPVSLIDVGGTAGEKLIGDLENRMPVSLPVGLLDSFGHLVAGSINNQIDIQWYRSDGSVGDLVTETNANGGTATASGGMATFACTTSANSQAKGVTTTNTVYTAGAEIYCIFTAAFTGTGAGTSYQRIGLYDTNNGFFIGYAANTFNFTVRKGASDSSTAKGSWNVDTLTGASTSKFTRGGTPEAVDLTKINVWRIRFGWVGSAPIHLEILAPDGHWVTCHEIRQPNNAAVPSIENADLPVTCDVNGGNSAAALSILTNCWCAGTTSAQGQLSADLAQTDYAQLVRSVITGWSTAGGGSFENVKVNPSGALTVSAAQDGTWNINNVSGTISLPTGAATAANQTTMIGHVDGIEGLLTTIDADTSTLAGAVAGSEMQVDIVSSATITVDSELPAAAALADDTANPTVPGVGAFGLVWDGATWDRMPGTSADGVTVNLGSNNDVTVTGTVTANLGTIADVATQTTLATIDTDTGNIAAGFATEGSALGSGVLIQGDDGVDRTNVLVDTDGHLQVDVLSGASGGTQYAVDTALGATPTGTLAIGIRDDALSTLTPIEGDAVGLRVDANGALWVIPSGTTTVSGSVSLTGNLPDTAAGDLAIINANTDSLAVVGGGTEATAVRVTIANDSTGVLSIDDNAGSITVDNGGTFAVQASQAGTWGVRTQDGSGNALTSATRGAEQALSVQIVDGSGSQVTSFGSGTQYAVDDALGATPTGTLAVAIRDDALSALTPVEGDAIGLRVDANGALWVIPSGTTTVSGSVSLTGSLPDTAAGDLAIINSNTDTLAVIGGGTEATALRVTLANDSTGVLSIDDNAGSITVDNGGTFAVQAAQNGTWSVRAQDGSGNALTSATRGAEQALSVQIVDGSGSQVTSFGGGTQYTEGDIDATIVGTALLMEGAADTLVVAQGTAADGLLVNLGSNNDVTLATLPDTAASDLATINSNTDSLAVIGGGTEATALRVTIANDSTGVLSIDDNAGSITVDNGGTFAVQAAQSGTWNVGTVTTVTTCSTVTTLTGGGVAHDGVDSGNPVKIGARASATLSDDTMVANADRTDAVSDLDGAIIVRHGFPLGDLLSERVSNTDGASTAFTNFAATASTRNYITAISCHNASATDGYIDFRDGTAGSVLYTVAIPAGGGVVLSNGGSPLFRTSANTALAYDVSAALTTVYISVTGFKSKV